METLSYRERPFPQRVSSCFWLTAPIRSELLSRSLRSPSFIASASFPAGATVYKCGAVCSGAWVPISGTLRLVFPCVGSGPISLTIRPGEAVGLTEALASRPYSSSLETATPSRLVRIGQDVLFSLLSADKDLRSELLLLLSQGLSRDHLRYIFDRAL